MKKHLLGITLLMVVLVVFFTLAKTIYAPSDLTCNVDHPSLDHLKNYTSKTIDFEKNKLHVWLANDIIEQQQGLSDTFCLPPNYGMLFEFNEPAIQKFWMKDMKYPLDIVWLDDNLKEIGRAKNADPKEYPKTYASPTMVKYVLEINVEK